MGLTTVEKRIRGEILGAKSIGYNVLMPEVRSLKEIFASCSVVKDLARYKSRPVHTWTVDRISGYRIYAGEGRATLSSFVSVRGKPHSLDVTFRPEVVKLVGEKMMLCDDYVINFQAVIRSNGVALIEAHYNLISGSRWFAFVPASELDGRRTRFGRPGADAAPA